MSKFIDKIDAYRRLGLGSLGRGLIYRLGVQTGLNPVRRLTSTIPRGEFFIASSRRCNFLPSKHWMDDEHAFGWFSRLRRGPFPNWFHDPIHNRELMEPNQPWWKIPDFSTDGCDIKCVWEASRMDWVIAMAQRSIASNHPTNHDEQYFGHQEVLRLNQWLNDWCQQNPPYQGPNWKCGQEASIRVLHLAAASVLLYGTNDSGSNWAENTTLAMVSFLSAHLRRIRPTIGYAIAQNNNHGLSEAAALFIGGSWLSSTAKANKGELASEWSKLGRNLIEDRVKTLFENDGSFSQYSVTYHRMALELLSIVEVWRSNLGLPKFSNRFYAKASAATNWLFAMTEPTTGDAPNIGHNDGSRLLPLTDCGYRDFRPTVQLAANLFCDCRAYSSSGLWDLPSQWLGIQSKTALLPVRDQSRFDDGGYAVFKTGTALHSDCEQTTPLATMAVLRYPRYRFRPSQADALHVDFWLDGKNILRDGGTFSYHTDRSQMDYFFGTASHNTIHFDGRDQMPRVSHFLFGRWLKSFDTTTSRIALPNEFSISSAYRDWKGAFHQRNLTLCSRNLQIEDQIDGFLQSAILRWRMIDWDWQQAGTTFNCGEFELKIASDIEPIRCEVVRQAESRQYWQKTELPVIEFEVNRPTTIRTTVQWQIS